MDKFSITDTILEILMYAMFLFGILWVLTHIDWMIYASGVCLALVFVTFIIRELMKL